MGASLLLLVLHLTPATAHVDPADGVVDARSGERESTIDDENDVLDAPFSIATATACLAALTFLTVSAPALSVGAMTWAGVFGSLAAVPNPVAVSLFQGMFLTALLLPLAILGSTVVVALVDGLVALIATRDVLVGVATTAAAFVGGAGGAFATVALLWGAGYVAALMNFRPEPIDSVLAPFDSLGASEGGTVIFAIAIPLIGAAVGVVLPLGAAALAAPTAAGVVSLERAFDE